MNKLQWKFKRNLYIFIQENVFETVVCEMPAIMFRPQCVKAWTKWQLPRSRHCHMHFIERKLAYFYWNFTEVSSSGSHWQLVSIDWVIMCNHAITWANVDYQCLSVSFTFHGKFSWYLCEIIFFRYAYIRHVSLQLSSINICYLWMWYSTDKECFTDDNKYLMKKEI